MYGFIQHKYWGVGFMKYYELKQVCLDSTSKGSSALVAAYSSELRESPKLASVHWHPRTCGLMMQL